MFTNESKLFKNFVFPYINIFKGEEIKKLFNFLKNVNIIPVNIISKSQIMSKSLRLESSFAESIIIQQTENLKNEQKIVLEINKQIIYVTIVSNDNTEKLLNSIISILQLLYSIHKINKEIHINLFLNDKQKLLTSNIIPCDIGVSEVNSGSCQRGYDKCIVNIWRKEELIKVLFHELIHAFEYDTIDDSSEIIEFYKKRYNISSNKININEAYTEIWANILNCFWLSQKVERKNYQCFQTLLGIEREFAKFQCNKIFHFTGLKNNTIDINEFTNVLAYYIIRCEIYNNLKEFLKLCRIHNKNYVKLNSEKFFISFLLKKTKEIKKNNKLLNKLKEESYLYKTTRMTAIEYNAF